MNVTVVWLDGSRETVRCDSCRVVDGTLRLYSRREQTRVIPLTSLREWIEVEP